MNLLPGLTSVLRPLALALLLALAAPLHAQPTPAQLEHIAALVEEGKLTEAKIRTETLLEVFPNDPTLAAIQRLLREKNTAPAPAAPSPAPVTSPAAPTPVPAIPTPSLNAWLGAWTAEATMDSFLPPAVQIEEDRRRVKARVTLSVRSSGGNIKIAFHGECWDDRRTLYADGKSAWHLRRHMKYEVPGRFTRQDITVANSGDSVSLRNIDFEEAARVMIKPTHVGKLEFFEKHTLKRHAFSADYTTLTLWLGVTDDYEDAEETEVILRFTLNPVAQSLDLSFDACLSFTQYTNATVPSITALEKVKPVPEAKP